MKVSMSKLWNSRETEEEDGGSPLRLGAAGRSPSSAAVTREARAAVGGKHRDGWGEPGAAPDSRYQEYITQLHSRHGGTAAP